LFSGDEEFEFGVTWLKVYSYFYHNETLVMKATVYKELINSASFNNRLGISTLFKYSY